MHPFLPIPVLRTVKIAFLVLALCSTGALGASESPSSAEALFEQGLAQGLVLAPSGDLIAWDLQAGRGFILGPRPGRTDTITELHGPRSFRLAVSPDGAKAFLIDGGRAVEVHPSDGEPLELELGQSMGDVVWLDEQHLAVSPENDDHVVEVWNIDSGELVQSIGKAQRISEAPGFQLLRATDLGWDPERRRLHTLDATHGAYRTYDLPEPGDGPSFPAPVEERFDTRIDDQNWQHFEERIAKLDQQLVQQGQHQGSTVWRFSLGLDRQGNAWTVERCEATPDEATGSSGVAHLLAVEPDGNEHRLTVATPCCASTAVPWGDSLAFAQPATPNRSGCFGTVPRPHLGRSEQSAYWLEAAPLVPSSDTASREATYRPNVVERFAAGDDPMPALARLGAGYTGLALACTGGEQRALDCEELWIDDTVDSMELGPVARALRASAGRKVTGRIAQDGTSVTGAAIALMPAELHTTRLLTLPLTLPEGDSQPIREVSTDTEGRFTLPALAPGDYRLLVKLPTGRMDHGTTFEVTRPRRGAAKQSKRDPGPIDLGTLDFTAGLQVDVQITADDGQPIPGALAGAAQSAPDPEGPAAFTLFEVPADPDGRALIEGLAPDLQVQVTCRAPGYAPWRETFESPPAFVDCRLEPLSRLTGRLVDEGGQPLTAGQVTLTGGSGYFSGAVETVELEQADDGRFSFDGLEAAGFRLSATSPGRSAESLSLSLEAGESRDVGDLVLEEGERWIHRVVDATEREPVAGATLTAFSPSGALRPATTDALGEVEVEGPATGPLTIEVRATGYAPRRVDVPEAVRTPGAEPHEIILERGGWIEASVWDETAEAPCVGCQISLYGAGPGQRLVTDGSGKARSEPLTPGNWKASLARIAGYGSMTTRSGGQNVRSVRVGSGTTSEVRFGDPEERLEVVLSPPPEQARAWELVVREVAGVIRMHRLDESGSATIERPEGGAVLALTRNGVTIDLGTLSEDATDPSWIERPTGAVSARLSPSLVGPDPLRLRLIDLASGRRAAEIDARPGARVLVPFLADGVYELRTAGRRLATVTVTGGRETDLGDLTASGGPEVP